MKLIGTLDSPHVRRVAICLDYLEFGFEHDAINVFTEYDKFQRVNPVAKAPSLTCDDGQVIMDSSLILQFAEKMSLTGRSLWPAQSSAFQRDARTVGLALAACEKSIQYLYETNLRPKHSQYAPWLSRVRRQLISAFRLIEDDLTSRPRSCSHLSNASISAAVTWKFAQTELDRIVLSHRHPELMVLSEELEALPVFLKYPPSKLKMTLTPTRSSELMCDPFNVLR